MQILVTLCHIVLVQEHKNIPYIVAELGLTKDKLYWGLNPELNPDKWTKVRPETVL